jgi:hypothetical protein
MGKQLSIRMEEELHNKFLQEIKNSGLSANVIINKLVEQYLLVGDSLLMGQPKDLLEDTFSSQQIYELIQEVNQLKYKMTQLDRNFLILLCTIKSTKLIT